MQNFIKETVMARGHGIGLSAAALVLALMGPAASSAEASDGLKCAIRSVETAGGVELKGVVISNGTIDGRYQFVVTGGGGSTNIMQSGDFSAEQGRPETLGVVTLGGGGRYTAKLKVTAGGKTFQCSQQI
jgi:hypothetical protein